MFCNQHGHLGHDALPACAAPLLRSAGSTSAGCQARVGHAATRCSWRAWGGGTTGGTRAHLVYAVTLRSASASRVTTIWVHGSLCERVGRFRFAGASPLNPMITVGRE